MSETLMIPQVSSPFARDRVDGASAYGWGVLLPTILLLRTIVFAVGVISVHTVHTVSQIHPDDASGFPWIAFDSHFYRYILLYGYPAGPEVPYHIAFFPLYPIASRLFLPIFAALAGTQAAPVAAMVAFSNICAIIGLCFTYAWARSITNARTAFIGTVLLALYPGSVFYSAGLTEGTFMMFVAIALFLLQKQRIFAAAAVSALATGCRPTAVSLAATVVIWTLWYCRKMPKSQLLLRVLIIGTLSVAGAASYQCYMWHRYQRFDAYKAAEDKWDLDADPIDSPKNQRLIEGVDQFWSSANLTVTRHEFEAQNQETPAQPGVKRYSRQFFIDSLTKTSAWNRAIVLALICVLVAAMFQTTPVSRLMLALPLIIFLMSYLPNFGLRASSILRYESAGVPLFIVLGIWLSVPRRKPLLLVVGGLSFAVQIYYAFLFSRGYWVG